MTTRTKRPQSIQHLLDKHNHQQRYDRLADQMDATLRPAIERVAELVKDTPAKEEFASRVEQIDKTIKAIRRSGSITDNWQDHLHYRKYDNASWIRNLTDKNAIIIGEKMWEHIETGHDADLLKAITDLHRAGSQAASQCDATPIASAKSGFGAQR